MRCRPWRPAFGPLVAVDTLLGVVREVGAELLKKAEIIIDAVEVEVWFTCPVAATIHG